MLAEQASLSAKVTYRAQGRAQDRICSCSTAAPSNVASYDYCLVERFLAPFAIFWGQCQENPQALQMLFVQVPQGHHLCAVNGQPEPLIQMSRTCYIFRGSSWLHPLIPVVSICQASSASVETSACAAVLFW